MATAEITRPGDWNVVGHSWAVEYLSRLDTPHHAWLFSGPRHVGKSTLVREFARALFCTGLDAPCGNCRACQLMADGAHPDFIVVAPMESDPEKAREDQTAKVDRDAGKLFVRQAETLITVANLRPMEARYKLFHIQDAERVTSEAFFNKLLKTIEEPPSHVILCITVSDRREILATVASRCHNVSLQPVERSTVRDTLIARAGLAPDRADLLARLANGRIGWALEQAQKGKLWEDREEQLLQLLTLVRGDGALRLDAAESMAKKKDARLFATLELWQGWWRDVLVLQSGARNSVINIDKLNELQNLAQEVAPAAVQAYLATLSDALAALRHTVNTRLALDMLLQRMPNVKGAS